MPDTSPTPPADPPEWKSTRPGLSTLRIPPTQGLEVRGLTPEESAAIDAAMLDGAKPLGVKRDYSPTPPPRSTEATLDETRRFEVADGLGDTPDDPLILALVYNLDCGDFLDGRSKHDESHADTRAAIRALRKRFAELRASLSAAEQENERLRTRLGGALRCFEEQTIRAQRAEAQRDRKASEVEALASGKVYREFGATWRIWQMGTTDDQNQFASHTEALHALLGSVIPPAASGATLARAQQHTTNESAP